MRRLWWHVLGRFYEARASRALKSYRQLKALAEKFFARVNGGDA